MVSCDRRDGLGIKMLKDAGFPMFILSTETNAVVDARAKKLKMVAHSGCENKKRFLEEYFNDNNVNSENVVYIGNDLNDLEAMELVGYSVCPNDSHLKIREISSYALKSNGGDGAVRELAELLIDFNGCFNI